MLPWIAVVMEGRSSPIGSRPAMLFRSTAARGRIVVDKVFPAEFR
jgi:hypothetical protein